MTEEKPEENIKEMEKENVDRIKNIQHLASVDNEKIEMEDIRDIIKKIYKKLDIRDLVIIILVLLLFFIYAMHRRDIESCVAFYNDILKNITKPIFSII